MNAISVPRKYAEHFAAKRKRLFVITLVHVVNGPSVVFLLLMAAFVGEAATAHNAIAKRRRYGAQYTLSQGIICLDCGLKKRMFYCLSAQRLFRSAHRHHKKGGENAPCKKLQGNVHLPNGQPDFSQWVVGRR